MIIINTEASIFYPEIIGTKAYRKPDWVVQMEDMQKVLKGMF